MRIHSVIFFLYQFWKSFLYFVEKQGFCGSTSSATGDLKNVMAVYTSKRNWISFAANSSNFAFGTVEVELWLNLAKVWCPMPGMVLHMKSWIAATPSSAIGLDRSLFFYIQQKFSRSCELVSLVFNITFDCINWFLEGQSFNDWSKFFFAQHINLC